MDRLLEPNGTLMHPLVSAALLFISEKCLSHELDATFVIRQNTESDTDTGKRHFFSPLHGNIQSDLQILLVV